MADETLFDNIRLAVAKIPRGKVLTYGDVARRVGITDARKVGWALHGNQDPKVPCHRVVKKDGLLAQNYSLGSWTEQRRLLENEGVEFVTKNQVDLEKHHWHP